MATNTYVAIDTKTISTATTIVEFTDIPQTYTDLVISVNCSTASDGESLVFQVGNNTIDTNANYSRTIMSGANDTLVAGSRNAGTSNISVQYAIGLGSDQPSSYQINFMDYANTSTYKTFLLNASTFRGTSTNKKEAMRLVGQWRSNSAINRIKFVSSVNLNVGSTFTLYGIASSNKVTPKAFGGTITQDATYTYHAFGASGTFTPQQSLTADVLVVAGGGGSGRTGGGGGAGGLRGLTSQSMTTTAYTITVGAGGVGATTDGSNATNGGNSSIAGSGFSTITASGGGGGASYNNSGTSIGSSGGSGGGGGTGDGNSYSRTGGAGNSGSYSPVEGFAGGNGVNSRGAGGGGGATAVGSNAPSTNNGGAGGAGSSAYSSWGLVTGTGQLLSGSYYYAGGGGGSGLSTNGAGGLGGGATGNNNGTANTGGGAGGSNDVNGKAGGSGIVIIRYAN